MSTLEGQHVWVPDKQFSWIRAKVIKSRRDGHTFECDLEVGGEPDGCGPTVGGVVTVDTRSPEFAGLDGLPLQNTVTPSGVEDMCALNYLHEPAILHNLRQRFFQNLPYTYTGNICIAVNPYQWLDIYNDKLATRYAQASKKSDLPPHAYATSAAAYAGLKLYGKNQSILVSGESGAGKTETVKILLKHLANVAGSEEGGDLTIKKVIESNPLLESFGNAKTVRNDNSSRFGKFLELQFSRGCNLLGSNVVTYLLEKSRVVHHSAGERTFHIFYQLLAAPEKLKQSCGLKGLTRGELTYAGMGGDTTEIIEGISDVDRFKRTVEALRLVGIDEEDCSALWRIVASVLLLGQVEFEHVMIGGQDCSGVQGGVGALAEIGRLLGVDSADLAQCLTSRLIVAAGESFQTPLSVMAANDARDGLAKQTYFKLFEWLVQRINESTSHPQGSDRKVGLLDIFGFESFVSNSYEQMCINYANEKLQQKFTEDVFKTVQEEYTKEGINWSHIDFNDNAPTLLLIDHNRTGVLAMLDEEGMLPKGSDEAFVAKVGKAHGGHANYVKSRLATQLEFTIKHYAGEVTYNAANWLDKNKDVLAPELQAILTGGNCPLVSAAFMPIGGPTSPTTPGKKERKGALIQESLGKAFRRQLSTLMDAISLTDVQYVRCIKPNRVKSSKIVDNNMVVEQLRCAGVIEAIRISRAAFPNRLSFSEFIFRFGMLVKKSKGKVYQATAASSLAIATALLPENKDANMYTIGTTRVYFRAGVLEDLEARRGNFVFFSTTHIQRVARGFLARRLRARLYRQRCAAIRLQCAARSKIARRKLAVLVAAEKARLERERKAREEAERKAAAALAEKLRKEAEALAAKLAAEEAVRQKALAKEEAARQKAAEKEEAARVKAAEKEEAARLKAEKEAAKKAEKVELERKKEEAKLLKKASSRNMAGAGDVDDFMFNEGGGEAGGGIRKASFRLGRKSSHLDVGNGNRAAAAKELTIDVTAPNTAERSPTGDDLEGEAMTGGRHRQIDSTPGVAILDGDADEDGALKSPRTARRKDFQRLDAAFVNESMNEDMCAFLVSTIPRHAGTLKCFVRRSRGRLYRLGGVETYSLYLEGGEGEDARFMMSATRRVPKIGSKLPSFTLNWAPEGSEESGRENSDKILAELVTTTKACEEFQLFARNAGRPPGYSSSRPVELMGCRYHTIGDVGDDAMREMPRQIQLALPDALGRDEEDAMNRSLLDLLLARELREHDTLLLNRNPRWNSKVQAYVLNFHGRVTEASVKNFQLVDALDKTEKIRLQFGRTGENEFTMDFSFPLSPLQAFGTALTCFAVK